MTSRAYGVDLHPEYQSDFVQTIEDFGILKVSEGAFKYPGYKEFASRFMFPVLGAYHYFRAGIPAREQYEPFLEASEDIGADFLAIDLEGTIEDFSKEDITHLKTMHDKCIDLTGKRVLLYASPNSIQKYIFDYGFDWIARKPERYPLWLARWVFNAGKWDDEYGEPLDVAQKPVDWTPLLPDGISDWKIWQFYVHDDEKMLEMYDMDVFNGSLSELKAWVNIKPDIESRLDKIERDIQKLTVISGNNVDGQIELVEDLIALEERVSNIQTEITDIQAWGATQNKNMTNILEKIGDITKDIGETHNDIAELDEKHRNLVGIVWDIEPIKDEERERLKELWKHRDFETWWERFKKLIGVE